MNTDDTYQRVYASIWEQAWQEDTRTLALYLLTCRHRRTEGIYRLRVAYAADDLAWGEAKVRKHLALLVDDGMVQYDDRASVVWIVNALHAQKPNTNQAKHAVKQLRKLPATPLLQAFAEATETTSKTLHDALLEHFAEAFEMGSANTSRRAA